MASEEELAPGKLEGIVLKGCYRIDQRVGKGGMAWVYKATHTMLLETVAVKIMFAQHAAEEELRERFLREARLQAKVKHANVLHVTDFIEERGVVGLVVEWVEGGDLQEWCDQRGLPLPVDALMGLMLPVLHAVEHAHSMGIIHRDLKPANIMLVPTPTGLPTPKLADFGLARQQHNTGLTGTNSSMGTPLYMAPEQFMDAKRVDERADVYSLGVILYQLASGTMPFQGDFNSLVYQIFEGERRKPAGVDSILSDIILRCIQKDPEARFATCQELAAALEEVHKGQSAAQGSALPIAPVVSDSGPLPSGSMFTAATEEAPPSRVSAEPTAPLAPHHHKQPAEAAPQPRAEAHTATTSTIPTRWALIGLVAILVVVGGAAIWTVRKLAPRSPGSTTQTQTAPRTRILRGPTAKRPLPPRKTIARPKAHKRTLMRPTRPATASMVLTNLTRSCGGRATFQSIKGIYTKGHITSFHPSFSTRYNFTNFALFPGYRRVELERSGQRILQVISPRGSYSIISRNKKRLPKRKHMENRTLHMLQTIEFTPPKMLHSIELGRPSWFNAQRVDVLKLGYGHGKKVTLRVSRRNHRVLMRSFQWKGKKHTYYYRNFQWFKVPGIKQGILWPTQEELYKDGVLSHRQITFTLQFNPPFLTKRKFR